MSFARNARRTAAVLAALAVGACSDSTAPTIDHIDASAATAAAAPVAAVMDQAALTSFTGIEGIGGLPASASAAALSAVSRLTAVAATGRWDSSAPLFARSAARAADVLPIDVRGKMYVYNTTTGEYEAAGTAEAGTPANGIRVILYAWNVVDDEPSVPLTRVGHVDLIDESTAAENRLHVVVVRATGNVELMNYDIRHSASTSTETFSITGTATNGVTPVTFNLSGTATQSSATITFHLGAASVGFSVDVGATVNEATQQATVETSLGYNGHTLSFRLSAYAVSANADRIDGEVKFDNQLYVTMTINIERTATSETVTTTVQKANGQPLTQEEADQLEAVFERALNFDRFWAALLWPLGIFAEPPV
jgi:hypothetical protein